MPDREAGRSFTEPFRSLDGVTAAGGDGVLLGEVGEGAIAENADDGVTDVLPHAQLAAGSAAVEVGMVKAGANADRALEALDDVVHADLAGRQDQLMAALRAPDRADEAPQAQQAEHLADQGLWNALTPGYLAAGDGPSPIVLREIDQCADAIVTFAGESHRC